MIANIRLLEKIQRIDQETAAILDEEKYYLKEIDVAAEELKRLEDEKAKLLPEIEAITGLVREVEVKYREAQDRMARNEKRNSEIKNDKELKALTKETNEAKKAAKNLEDELKNLNSKLDAVKGAVASKDNEIDGRRSDTSRLTMEMEEKRPGWRDLIMEKNNERDALKAGVRPDVYKKYETIRTRKGGRALVSVKKETCQGCFIHIPPQAYIELKKGGDEIITCPHCYRILYVEEQIRQESA